MPQDANLKRNAKHKVSATSLSTVGLQQTIVVILRSWHSQIRKGAIEVVSKTRFNPLGSSMPARSPVLPSGVDA